MTSSSTHPGICLLCNAQITRRNVTRHIKNCLDLIGWDEKKPPGYLIKVTIHESSYWIDAANDNINSYWLFLLASPDATLVDLDQAIRCLWVECCGHASLFEIQKTEYFSTDFGEDEIDYQLMGGVKLSQVLHDKIKFDYEYDFGTPTRLLLTVSGRTELMPPEGNIVLIARNTPPTYLCSMCPQPAHYISQDCRADLSKKFIYCDNCAKNHGCENSELISIPNSPRFGVCGYNGDGDSEMAGYPAKIQIKTDTGAIGKRNKERLSSKGETNGLSLIRKGTHEILQPVGFDLRKGMDKISDDMDLAEKKVKADMQRAIDRCVRQILIEKGVELAEKAEYDIIGFAIFQYWLYKSSVKRWNYENVKGCLVNYISTNLFFDDIWTREFISILCWFFGILEELRIVRNASELIKAAKEADRILLNIPKKSVDLKSAKDKVTKRVLADGIGMNNPEIFDAKVKYALVDEVLNQIGLGPKSPEWRAFQDIILSGFMQEKGIAVEGTRESIPYDTVRKLNISSFSHQFSYDYLNGSIESQIDALHKQLVNHEADPLSRGGVMNWAAAIVYTVCQQAGLIGRSAPKNLLDKKIADHFDANLSSIRSKSTLIKNLVYQRNN